MTNETIYSLLNQRTINHPDHIAIESPGRYPLTYSGLLQLVQQIAMSLVKLGITPESRIAVILPNSPEMAVVMLGVSSVAACVPLNPEYRKVEYERYFKELKIDLIIVEQGKKSAAKSAAIKCGIKAFEFPLSKNPNEVKFQKYLYPVFSNQPVSYNNHKPLAISDFSQEQFREEVNISPGPGDAAVIMHTTGTTGKSKVVVLSHQNVLEAAANISISLELDSADRCLAMLPQFHIGGLVDLLLAPLYSGGSVVCTAGFEAPAFFSCVHEFQPTWFQAVPTMLYELLNYSRENESPLANNSLRFIRSVSSPLPPELMSEMESCFNLPIIEIYGMTEAGPLITSNPLPPGERKAGSVGVPQGPEVRIIDSSGKPLPVNQLGEVAIRGTSVFKGYENDAAVPGEVFLDGWFRTGDLGYFDDDGYLFLQGRTKEMINRGGEKISPFDIDSAILKHPQVALAVSFPIPHRTLGEIVAALVVLKPDQAVTERELQDFLSRKLARFKIPQRLVFVESLPREATGKVKRMALAEKLGLDYSTEFVAPRTSTETELASLWADVLDLEIVGVKEDFFDLGGNSLIGVRLFEKIENLVGHKLPEEIMYELSTIENMARSIDQIPDFHSSSGYQGGHDSKSILSDEAIRSIKSASAASRCPTLSPGSVFIQQNSNGARVPLFWCFNRPDREMVSFSKALGEDQPVIGFYSGSNLFLENQEVIEATAEYYVYRLLELNLKGPIIIGGHCRGAAVSLEMAIILNKRNYNDISLMLVEYFHPKCFLYSAGLTLLYGRQSRVLGYKPFNFG